MVARRASAVSTSASSDTRRTSTAHEVEVPDYCARPMCRQQFVRTIGRGRPQAYCSEMCRRAAERELRQAQAKLAHFEAVVQQLRVDVAAFGASDVDPVLEAARTADAAVTRTAGILAFLDGSEEPLARELRAIHDAVVPLVVISRNG